MTQAVDQISTFSTHPIELTGAALLLVLPLRWRAAGPPERATVLALGGLAVLDLLVWLAGGSSLVLHIGADAVALSWMVPVALRANRFYPSIVAAALLVAVLAQAFYLADLVQAPDAVGLLVTVLHVIGVLACFGGVLMHQHLVRQGFKRPGWRNQLPHG